MMEICFDLPPVIEPLVAARSELRRHYGHPDLKFTFDGNLVGDIGEAIAIELFGLALTERCREGIDGFVGSKSVQVKATGTGRGPAFRKVDTEADHLLFFRLDFDERKGWIEFNGPERIARTSLRNEWSGQRQVSLPAIRRANLLVPEGSRLRRIDRLASQSAPPL